MKLLFLLAVNVFAASVEPPFLIREPKTERDAQAVNESLRSISDNVRGFRNNYKADILDDNNTWSGNTTFTGSVSASSGVTTNKVTFNDGTILTSTTTIGVSTSTYNVFVSSNDFRATVGFGSSAAGTTGRHPITVWAKSVDGATQSSGCVVALSMSDAGNSSSENAFMQFTSTTSVDQYGPAVLLDNTCAPGAYCRVAVSGLVRATGKSGIAIGVCVATSDTRCQSATGGAVSSNSTCVGTALSTTNGGGQWFWVLMGTR